MFGIRRPDRHGRGTNKMWEWKRLLATIWGAYAVVLGWVLVTGELPFQSQFQSGQRADVVTPTPLEAILVTGMLLLVVSYAIVKHLRPTR